MNPVYLEHFTDDVETLFQGGTGDEWEFEYLQLSPGPLGAWAGVVQLPQLAIHWFRSRPRLHVLECHKHDGLFIGLLRDASSSALWRGKEVGPEHALLYRPGQEQDYITPRNLRSIGFMFSEGLYREMGWELGRASLIRINRDHARRVEACATDITRRVRRGGVEAEEARILQERLLLCLDALLEPRLSLGGGGGLTDPPADRQFRLVQLARRQMEDWDPAEKLDVRVLARRIGTSVRTLYRAFSSCLGLGPYEYYMLLRLRMFRGTMRALGATHGALTEAANVAGFDHMGRLSATYRKHYGELPSGSLKRWKRELSASG